MYLFGGDKPWDASQFTASDDRVRGGQSQSYLTVSAAGGAEAEFSGTLDIKTLGGAGFASQRTVDGLPAWDLSGYDALVLHVARGDANKYTVTLKDEVLPRRPDGREQSTVSWEYDFVVGGAEKEEEAGGTAAESSGRKLVIPFADFEPTYRGRAKPDAEPLDLKNVQRISFMMRSFFGTQEGDFSIVFKSVSAEGKGASSSRGSDSSIIITDVSADQQQAETEAGYNGSGPTSWLGRLFGWKI
ncbi:unnamed protein product [Discula destructiva]